MLTEHLYWFPIVTAIFILISTIMSRPNEIRILNPFNLQYGSNFAVQQRIQEIVNYAESRCTAAILAIETIEYNASMRHQMYQALQDELVMLF